MQSMNSTSIMLLHLIQIQIKFNKIDEIKKAAIYAAFF
jgi:hypothetical protein